MRKKSVIIILCVLVACVLMGLVDAVIQPGYAIKSLIKIVLFLVLPGIYSVFDREAVPFRVLKPKKSGFIIALGMGLAVYAVVLGAYFIFRNVFDFSALTKSLTETTGVSRDNFIFVALYISFVNSLLEEFFFRGFAYLTLSRYINGRVCGIISSALFAAYHIAMMIGWFNIAVVGLAMVGLMAGGLIFCSFDHTDDNIYRSWLIHMFANFATNTIGFILFSA